MKHKDNMAMAYKTITFEAKTAMNHVNKYKSSNLPNRLAWKLLEELRKQAQPSDLSFKVELRSELNKLQIEKEDDPEVPRSALSENKNK